MKKLIFLFLLTITNISIAQNFGVWDPPGTSTSNTESRLAICQAAYGQTSTYGFGSCQTQFNSRVYSFSCTQGSNWVSGYQTSFTCASGLLLTGSCTAPTCSTPTPTPTPVLHCGDPGFIGPCPTSSPTPTSTSTGTATDTPTATDTATDTSTNTATNTPLYSNQCPIGEPTQNSCMCGSVPYSPQPCPQGNMCTETFTCHGTTTPTTTPQPTCDVNNGPCPTQQNTSVPSGGGGGGTGGDGGGGTGGGGGTDSDGDGIPDTATPTPTNIFNPQECTTPVPENSYCDCNTNTDDFCHNPYTLTNTPTDEPTDTLTDQPTDSPTDEPTDLPTPTTPPNNTSTAIPNPTNTGIPTPTPNGCQNCSTSTPNPSQTAATNTPIPNLVSGGSDCDAPPTCTGDQIQCAQLLQQWHLRCDFTNSDNIDESADISVLKDNSSSQLVTNSFNNFITTAETQTSATCPGYFEIDISFTVLTFDVTPWCDFFTTLRPIIKVLFTLAAFFILFRGL